MDNWLSMCNEGNITAGDVVSLAHTVEVDVSLLFSCLNYRFCRQAYEETLRPAVEAMAIFCSWNLIAWLGR